MKSKSVPFLIFLFGLSAATIYYWAGILAVPFHPDESTYLYTSSDFKLFLKHPSSIYWTPEKVADKLQDYRLLNAPLINNLIGLSRQITAQAALPADWDWSKTWEANQQAGALPSAQLLFAGRMASAALFPYSILLIYLVARKIAGEFAAWTAAILLASNSLVLLHTRRAMSEGPLLFILTLSLWGLVYLEKQSGWLAIPTALAFCAKQSLAALSPVGFLAVLWPTGEKGHKWVAQVCSQAVLYIGLSLLVIILLNPFLWGNPIKAIAAAITTRQELASRQIADRPAELMQTIPQKLAGMVANLYFTAPAFAEVANYQAETLLSEQIYRANPIHSLLRSIPGGAFLLTLNLFGFLLAMVDLRSSGYAKRRVLLLLLLANLLQFLIIFMMIPFPWQRYYLPLVPFVCLWSAYGSAKILQGVGKALAARRHNYHSA